MNAFVLIIGGGDLATGITHRLFSCGFDVAVTELEKPRMVRRTVCFGTAVYEGSIEVEGVKAVKTDKLSLPLNNVVPVLAAPDLSVLKKYRPDIIIDAKMAKKQAADIKNLADFTVGIGPGFNAGENVHAVVETKRGLDLGRVYFKGSAIADTGIPEFVLGKGAERVLRSPAQGFLKNISQIGDRVKQGQILASVGGIELLSPFDGCLRGLACEGLFVEKGEKIGDVDPRTDADCYKISDKARAVGGGVLEAILSFFEWKLVK